jgi:hypothetical protein
MRKQVEKLILKDCNKFFKKLQAVQAAQPSEEIIDMKMYYIQNGYKNLVKKNGEIKADKDKDKDTN